MHTSAQVDQPSAGLVVREATPEDAERLAQIFYDAFESIATRHHFPVEPGSREFTLFKVSDMLSSGEILGLVAEHDDGPCGCAFVDQRGPVGGIGPVVVGPMSQDAGVGRALMEAALEREGERGAAGVRLVQTAYHYRSFALYAKLGFVVREPLTVLQGVPRTRATPGRAVRAADEADVAGCIELCRQVHGHSRARELQDAVQAGTARVVERAGSLTGYATGLGYGWHAVAETNEDLIALLDSGEPFMGLGILVPSRNAALLRWGLDRGLRVVQQSTLMTIGLYNEPAGAYLPSIVF